MELDFINYQPKKRRIKGFLERHGIASLNDAQKLCEQAGLDIKKKVRDIQPLCFEDACWAYIAGAAAALAQRQSDPVAVANTLGEGLQAFCLEGSVADERQVGAGHGKLAAILLDENTRCFCFLAGHESFAASSGALAVAKYADLCRRQPLRVILLGLGKDAADIIARFNGFTYAATDFDYKTEQLELKAEIRYSRDRRADIRCYGAGDTREGVAIMEHEGVDVAITGNGTNMVRFTHLVAGTYKKRCIERGQHFFACASGGGIGRTLGPDETSAGPASYGLTDSMSRMWGDSIFAGSSSVSAHVEMMGFVGMGNNPMVGATVAVSAAVAQAVLRIESSVPAGSRDKHALKKSVEV